MADPVTPPAPTPAPPPPLDMSAQTSAARDAWIAQGHDVKVFDASLRSTKPPATTPEARPGPMAAMRNGFRSENLSSLADTLLKQGVAPEKVAAAAAASGIAWRADERDAEERQFDAGPAGPATDLPDYRIDLRAGGHEWSQNMKPEQAASFRKELQTALGLMLLPAAIGTQVAEQGLATASKYTDMDTEAAQEYHDQQDAKLAKISGTTLEKIKANVRIAYGLVHERAPELAKTLLNSGFFSSAENMLALSQNVERMLYRVDLADRRVKRTNP